MSIPLNNYRLRIHPSFFRTRRRYALMAVPFQIPRIEYREHSTKPAGEFPSGIFKRTYSVLFGLERAQVNYLFE